MLRSAASKALLSVFPLCWRTASILVSIVARACIKIAIFFAGGIVWSSMTCCATVFFVSGWFRASTMSSLFLSSSRRRSRRIFSRVVTSLVSSFRATNLALRRNIPHTNAVLDKPRKEYASRKKIHDDRLNHGGSIPCRELKPHTHKVDLSSRKRFASTIASRMRNTNATSNEAAFARSFGSPL